MRFYKVVTFDVLNFFIIFSSDNTLKLKIEIFIALIIFSQFGFAQTVTDRIKLNQQGFFPNVISTDLHTESMNAGMKDMSNVMSKFLAMGMSLPDVILRSTCNPANVIHRPELGNLSVGSGADVAVFDLKKGDFGFLDIRNTLLKGTQKLQAELTIRDGKIVWNLNGLGAPSWQEALQKTK